jgi:hypothetical protein
MRSTFTGHVLQRRGAPEGEAFPVGLRGGLPAVI